MGVRAKVGKKVVVHIRAGEANPKVYWCDEFRIAGSKQEVVRFISKLNGNYEIVDNTSERAIIRDY